MSFSQYEQAAVDKALEEFADRLDAINEQELSVRRSLTMFSLSHELARANQAWEAFQNGELEELGNMRKALNESPPTL